MSLSQETNSFNNPFHHHLFPISQYTSIYSNRFCPLLSISGHCLPTVLQINVPVYFILFFLCRAFLIRFLSMYAYMHVTMHTIQAHTTIYRIKALVHVSHMYDIQEPVHIAVFIPQGENSHDTQQKGHSYFSCSRMTACQPTTSCASPTLSFYFALRAKCLYAIGRVSVVQWMLLQELNKRWVEAHNSWSLL